MSGKTERADLAERWTPARGGLLNWLLLVYMVSIFNTISSFILPYYRTAGKMARQVEKLILSWGNSLKSFFYRRGHLYFLIFKGVDYLSLKVERVRSLHG